jgi:hypothetical protein
MDFEAFAQRILEKYHYLSDEDDDPFEQTTLMLKKESAQITVDILRSYHEELLKSLHK